MTSSADASECEQAAIRAFLLGADHECATQWEAAHRAALAAGQPAEAARLAFWLGFLLLAGGQTARANGWLARSESLIAQAGVECRASGYLLIPQGLAALEAGDPRRARELSVRAADIGHRFDDADLHTFGTLCQGQALIALGEPDAGVAKLDEVMVAVTTGELNPIATGIAYCAVILECVDLFDLRRAAEWTEALSGRIPPFFEALERALVEQISAGLGGFVSAVFSMHDPDDVAGLLREAGLRDVSSTVLTTTLMLPAPAQFLWQYIGLTPMAASIEQTPPAARAALERQFVDEAREHVVDGVTVVDLPMVFAAARA